MNAVIAEEAGLPARINKALKGVASAGGETPPSPVILEKP